MTPEMKELLNDLYIHCMETGDQKVWEILFRYLKTNKKMDESIAEFNEKCADALNRVYALGKIDKKVSAKDMEKSNERMKKRNEEIRLYIKKGGN